jgi:hypothetical protein
MKNTRNDSQRISRRDFLKVVTVTGAAGLLAGCRPASLPTATPPSPTPTADASIVRRPEIIKVYPDVLKSKVVHTHHAGVWTGAPQDGADENNLLAPQALRQMLDRTITELTGLNDATQAWAALFGPEERVAIKVNTLWGGLLWTHAPLAMAVAECLQEAGVPAGQIVIYDRSSEELARAGFTINKDGPGVRCYGTAETWNEAKTPAGDSFTASGNYTAGWKLTGKDIRLSDILLQCDALINMSILRVHEISGVSFGMKNHYGTLDRPWDFHDTIRVALAELNALPPIKDRTRLIIGDILAVNTIPYNMYPWTMADVIGDSILMSFDPVAHDTIGLQVLMDTAQASGNPLPAWAKPLSEPWLTKGAALGLGTNDSKNIELVELSLG